MKRKEEILSYIGVVILLLILSGRFSNAADGKSTVTTLETRHTQVFFQTEADVWTFDKKISSELSAAGLSTLSAVENGDDSAARLTRKIDGLFGRVQEVLDMRKAMEKVQINVYSNKNALQAAYNKFQSGKCRIRAWYVFEENSVYVSAADVNAGMLGHELAHAIIDHFFQVRPPKATAEILARYVDRHIDN